MWWVGQGAGNTARVEPLASGPAPGAEVRWNGPCRDGLYLLGFWANNPVTKGSLGAA